jgi:mediator of RNA polymerase II transcription subunit 10
LTHVYATDTSVEAILTAEAQLKDIVQNLYNLIVQSYDHRGGQTQEAMKREMYVYQILAMNIG